MASTLRTTEQIKSEYAFNFAKNASGLGSNYKSYVKKLPMLIKTNGLGATFAFMYSKKHKNEGRYWEQIGSDIYNWLKHQNKIDENKVKSFDDLVPFLNKISSTEYRMFTAEILSFLAWLRRFADGLIQGD